MKYFCILFITLCCSLSSYADESKGFTKEQAREVVLNFYGALKDLHKVDQNMFYEYRNTNIYPYLIDNRAFRHPNDIQTLIAQNSQKDTWRLINSYMGYIRKCSDENGLKIDFNICDVKDLREVVYENKKERLALTYWEIIVNKSFCIDGHTHVLNDTVDVKISNGKIAFISNRIYREESPKPELNDGKGIEAWHHELIARAARYWNQGRKREAYDAYVRSVEDYDDPDTYFRIGVLLLKHHKECTDYNKTKARNLAYSYFCKARKFGHSEADRVIEWHWGNYGGHAI